MPVSKHPAELQEVTPKNWLLRLAEQNKRPFYLDKDTSELFTSVLLCSASFRGCPTL